MLMIYVPLVIARWIHFASVFVLFGASFFWFYAGASRYLAGAGGLQQTLRATTVSVRIAAPIAAVSGIAWLACVLINMARDYGSVLDPEDLRLFFFETPFGTVSIVRLALFAIAIAIAFLPRHKNWQFAVLVPVSAALLVTQAWFGHSAEGKGLYHAAMIAVYGVHATATAAWVGGLMPLLFALAEQRRRGPVEEARCCALDILSRFSVMAMAAVALIVASGIANAGFRVEGDFFKLLDSDYGDILLKKIALVAAMLAFACINRFLLMPGLRAAPLKRMKQIALLRLSVSCELTVGIFVLGASAILGITMPPM